MKVAYGGQLPAEEGLALTKVSDRKLSELDAAPALDAAAPAAPRTELFIAPSSHQ
jgi:hypothetical protein